MKIIRRQIILGIAVLLVLCGCQGAATNTPVLSQTPIPASTVYSLDNFAGANGSLLTAHIPDIGPLWRIMTDPTKWILQSGALTRSYFVIDQACVDTKQTDVVISANFTSLNGLSSLLVRRQNGGNYWGLFYDTVRNGWQMDKVLGGPDQFQGPLLPGSIGIVSLSAKGNTITAVGPRGDVFSVTDPALNTQTQACLVLDGDGTNASTVKSWKATSVI